MELAGLEPATSGVRQVSQRGRLSPMDELVVVEVVATEPEAELLCSLLRNAGIKCTHRLSNYGAGASDGMRWAGPKRSSSGRTT
jgi:hypothetical protein